MRCPATLTVVHSSTPKFPHLPQQHGALYDPDDDLRASRILRLSFLSKKYNISSRTLIELSSQGNLKESSLPAKLRSPRVLHSELSAPAKLMPAPLTGRSRPTTSTRKKLREESSTSARGELGAATAPSAEPTTSLRRSIGQPQPSSQHPPQHPSRSWGRQFAPPAPARPKRRLWSRLFGRWREKTPPVQLGTYTRLKQLGRGRFGEVYLVQEESTARLMVLKSVQRRNLDAPARHEARYLLKLRAHPNIIKLHDVLEDGPDKLALVMDYADGGDLSMRISRARDEGGPLKTAEALHVFVQIASALQHCHKRGVVHRDVKPANIFLTLQGIVRLGDFGIAKDFHASGPDDKASSPGGFGIAGTPLYMSPEGMQGEDLGRPSDVWALGVVLYEMLTLSPPFTASCLPLLVRAIVLKEYHPLPPTANVEVKRLLDGLLKKRPDERTTLPSALLSPLCRQLAYRYKARALSKCLARETRLHQILDEWSESAIGGPRTVWSKESDWYKSSKVAQVNRHRRVRENRMAYVDARVAMEAASYHVSGEGDTPPCEPDAAAQGELPLPDTRGSETVMDLLHATASTQRMASGGLKVRAVLRLAAGAVVAEKRRSSANLLAAAGGGSSASARSLISSYDESSPDRSSAEGTEGAAAAGAGLQATTAAAAAAAAAGKGVAPAATETTAGTAAGAAAAANPNPAVQPEAQSGLQLGREGSAVGSAHSSATRTTCTCREVSVDPTRGSASAEDYAQSTARSLASASALPSHEGSAKSIPLPTPPLSRSSSRGSASGGSGKLFLRETSQEKKERLKRREDAKLKKAQRRSLPFDNLGGRGSSAARGPQLAGPVRQMTEPPLWNGSNSAPPLSKSALRTAKSLRTYACEDEHGSPGQLWLSNEHVCFTVAGGSRVLIHISRISEIHAPNSLFGGKASGSLRFVIYPPKLRGGPHFLGSRRPPKTETFYGFTNRQSVVEDVLRQVDRFGYSTKVVERGGAAALVQIPAQSLKALMSFLPLSGSVCAKQDRAVPPAVREVPQRSMVDLADASIPLPPSASPSRAATR